METIYTASCNSDPLVQMNQTTSSVSSVVNLDHVNNRSNTGRTLNCSPDPTNIGLVQSSITSSPLLFSTSQTTASSWHVNSIFNAPTDGVGSIGRPLIVGDLGNGNMSSVPAISGEALQSPYNGPNSSCHISSLPPIIAETDDEVQSLLTADAEGSPIQQEQSNQQPRDHDNNSHQPSSGLNTPPDTPLMRGSDSDQLANHDSSSINHPTSSSRQDDLFTSRLTSRLVNQSNPSYTSTNASSNTERHQLSPAHSLTTTNGGSMVVDAAELERLLDQPPVETNHSGNNDQPTSATFVDTLACDSKCRPWSSSDHGNDSCLPSRQQLDLLSCLDAAIPNRLSPSRVSPSPPHSIINTPPNDDDDNIDNNLPDRLNTPSPSHMAEHIQSESRRQSLLLGFSEHVNSVQSDFAPINTTSINTGDDINVKPCSSAPASLSDLDLNQHQPDQDQMSYQSLVNCTLTPQHHLSPSSGSSSPCGAIYSEHEYIAAAVEAVNATLLELNNNKSSNGGDEKGSLDQSSTSANCDDSSLQGSGIDRLYSLSLNPVCGAGNSQQPLLSRVVGSFGGDRQSNSLHVIPPPGPTLVSGIGLVGGGPISAFVPPDLLRRQVPVYYQSTSSSTIATSFHQQPTPPSPPTNCSFGGHRPFSASLSPSVVVTASDASPPPLSSKQPHTGGDFECPTCCKAFPSRTLLTKHRVMHDEPRHNCPNCDRCFVREDKLKRHIRSIHTTDKPHVCPICHKAFSRKDKLKEHIQHHERAASTFQCEICQQCFVQKSDLNRHVRGVHQGEPGIGINMIVRRRPPGTGPSYNRLSKRQRLKSSGKAASKLTHNSNSNRPVTGHLISSPTLVTPAATSIALVAATPSFSYPPAPSTAAVTAAAQRLNGQQLLLPGHHQQLVDTSAASSTAGIVAALPPTNGMPAQPPPGPMMVLTRIAAASHHHAQQVLSSQPFFPQMVGFPAAAGVASIQHQQQQLALAQHHQHQQQHFLYQQQQAYVAAAAAAAATGTQLVAVSQQPQTSVSTSASSTTTPATVQQPHQSSITYAQHHQTNFFLQQHPHHPSPAFFYNPQQQTGVASASQTGADGMNLLLAAAAARGQQPLVQAPSSSTRNDLVLVQPPTNPPTRPDAVAAIAAAVYPQLYPSTLMLAAQQQHHQQQQLVAAAHQQHQLQQQLQHHQQFYQQQQHSQTLATNIAYHHQQTS